MIKKITEDYAHQISSGKTILIPTDSLWSIFYSPKAKFPEAFADFPPLEPSHLYFPSVEKLRTFYPRLHPKIDNLLYYTQRSAIIRLPIAKPDEYNFTNRSHLLCRVAISDDLKAFLNLFDHPLFCFSAFHKNQAPPFSFSTIPMECKNAVDYQFKPAWKLPELSRHSPSLILKFDEKTGFEQIKAD